RRDRRARARLRRGAPRLRISDRAHPLGSVRAHRAQLRRADDRPGCAGARADLWFGKRADRPQYARGSVVSVSERLAQHRDAGGAPPSGDAVRWALAPPAIALTTVAAAQQPPTFRSGVDLVRLDVSVMRGGQPVRGLTPKDFRILDR